MESCPSPSFSWSSSWECLPPRHPRHPCRSLKRRSERTFANVLFRVSRCWFSRRPGSCTFLLLWNALHFLLWLFLLFRVVFVFLWFLFLHLLSICETTLAKTAPWRHSRRANYFGFIFLEWNPALLWMAGLSSSDASSFFLLFSFLGLASFPFSFGSMEPFASSFFFFGFYIYISFS